MKLKNFFLSIFYFFYNFRKSLKFKKFEKNLDAAIQQKLYSKKELILAINTRIKNFYPKSVSKYIPLSWKQKREIKAAIDTEFGKQMKDLDVKINKNLNFV